MLNTAEPLLNDVKLPTTMPTEPPIKVQLDPPSTHSAERDISSHWEQVNFEPYERKEYEYEQLQTEYIQARESTIQNARGVDVDSETHQPSGSVKIDSIQVVDFPKDTTSATTRNLYYVSMILTPSTASNAKTKRHQTPLKERPLWLERIVFDSIKSKRLSLHFCLYEHIASEFIPDKCLAQAKVTMEQLLHQKTQELVLPLLLSGSGNNVIPSTLRIQLTFHYDRVRRLASNLAKLESQVCALKDAKRIYEHNHAVFRSHAVHPSSLGKQTLETELYLPGLRFNIQAHHPGAVLRMPFSDRTWVDTPFGKGTVVAYRSLRRLYTIRLVDNSSRQDQGGGKLAYVHADQVTENLDPKTSIQLDSEVETPYGTGQVVDMTDATIKVQLSWGIASCRREDVRLPLKKVEDMSDHEKLRQAKALTDLGNTCVKDKVWLRICLYMIHICFIQCFIYSHI